MLDYEKQQKLFVVFVLGTILVVIGTIVALIFIWMPEEEQKSKFEVGRVDYTSVKSADVLGLYTDHINKLILNKDLGELYNMVGKDYLEYVGYSREDFYDYIEDKNLIGKKIEMQQYKQYALEGYSNIYDVEFKVPNEAYTLNVVIRETSPEKYTIAFDKFIDIQKDKYKVTVNSVSLNITQVARFTNSVEYEMIIRNNYNKAITLNYGGASEPVIMVSESGESKTPILSTMDISPTRIDAGDSKNYRIAFAISSTNDYAAYNYFVLQSVMFEGMMGTNNLEYKFK